MKIAIKTQAVRGCVKMGFIEFIFDEGFAVRKRSEWQSHSTGIFL